MSLPPTFDTCQQRAKTVQLRGQAFIDGHYVNAASGETFDCISPLDG